MLSDIKKKDIFFGFFFIFFLLIPLFYTNLTLRKIKHIPSFLSCIYSTSNLFTYANYIWPNPYIQAKEGDQWVTLPEEEYFRMPTFGYRTRLFEGLFPTMNDKGKIEGIRREMAQWVAAKYQRLYPDRPIQAVRFIAGLQRAQLGYKPASHWAQPPPESFAPEDTYVIYEYDLMPLEKK